MSPRLRAAPGLQPGSSRAGPNGWLAGAAVRGGVGFGGDAGGGLLAEPDVAAEAGEVLVAGLGLEFGSGAAIGGQVLEGRVA